MATPTQSQPYAGGNPYPAGATQGGPPAAAQSAYASDARPTQSAQGNYGHIQSGHQFEKYCVMHIATTCDEHGVYVTKDSAETIEMGWVILDARDPSLPEVSAKKVDCMI